MIIAAEPVLNSNAIKSQIERIVSDTIDMNFKIGGRIELSYWPFLSMVANKLNVITSQGELASADRIEINPRLLELMRLKVHIEDVHLQTPDRPSIQSRLTKFQP